MHNFKAALIFLFKVCSIYTLIMTSRYLAIFGLMPIKGAKSHSSQPFLPHRFPIYLSNDFTRVLNLNN